MGGGGLFDHPADLAAQVALAFAFDAGGIRGRRIRRRQRKIIARSAKGFRKRKIWLAAQTAVFRIQNSQSAKVVFRARCFAGDAFAAGFSRRS